MSVRPKVGHELMSTILLGHDSSHGVSCLQADSNCSLTVTSTSAEAASTDDSVETGSDNITWLKWTGAAVLFVEALIVSAPCIRL